MQSCVRYGGGVGKGNKHKRHDVSTSCHDRRQLAQVVEKALGRTSQQSVKQLLQLVLGDV